MATFTVSTTQNYTDLSGIVNNDNITISNGGELTIEQSTVDLRQIQCTTFGTLIVSNTSTTTPIFINIGSTTTNNRRLRFEAGGEMRVRGDKIQIGTGTGVAGQVVNLPQDAGLNNCPELGGLWVDHGDTLRDTTSVLRPYLQVADASNAITLDEVSEIFTQDTGLNQVTFAKAVPLNAPIYMANIVIKQGDSISVGDTPFTDFALSGTVDWEWLHFSEGFDMSFSNAKSSRMINCAFAKASEEFNFASQILAAEIKSCIFTNGNNTNCVTMQNSPIFGSHINNWYDKGRADGNGYLLTAQTTSEGYIEKCKFTSYNLTAFTTENQKGEIYMNNAVNMRVYDCTFAGSAVAFYILGGSSDVIIDNTKFIHGCRTTHVETESMYCFRSAACSNITVSRYYHQDPSIQGTFQPRNDAFIIGAGTVNLTMDDVVLYAGAGTGGASIDSIFNETGLGCRYNNFLIYGLFDARMIDFQTASLNAELSNIRVDQNQTITTSSELGAGCKIDQVTVGRSTSNIATTAVGTGTDCLSAMFYEWNDTDKTNARLYTRMSPTVNETDYYTEVVKNGQVIFNNNNRLYMDTIGDQIELEGRVHYNVSSCNSYGTNGSNVSAGWTIDFALRRPEGTYTAWQNVDGGSVSTLFNNALATLDADAQNRVQVKWRITRDLANFTDYIQQLYFDLNLTGDDYPFSIGSADLNLTGLQPNSEVRVYDGVTEILGVENSGTSFTGTYSVPYSAGEFSDINATIVIHSLGYVPVRLENVTLGSSGASIPIQQRIDRNYNNP